MNSEAPTSCAEMLKTFPDDDKLKEWQKKAANNQGDDTGEPAMWGEGIVWAELHESY